MPDLSPELMDVVAMLRERQLFWEELAFADGDARLTLARADELRVIVDAIERGQHIGSHERARKVGG